MKKSKGPGTKAMPMMPMPKGMPPKGMPPKGMMDKKEKMFPDMGKKKMPHKKGK